MPKKKQKRFKDLAGLEAPSYNASFAKEFPHMDVDASNADEDEEYELVEVEDDEVTEGLPDAQNYKSPSEVNEELEEVSEDLNTKKGFFSKFFKKIPKKVQTEELAKVREVSRRTKVKKLNQNTKANEKEEEKRPVFFKVPKGVPKRRVKTEVFDNHEEELQAENIEKQAKPLEPMPFQESKIVPKKTTKKPLPSKDIARNKSAPQAIPFEKEHKPKKYVRPYVNYDSLKKELKQVNKKLISMK